MTSTTITDQEAERRSDWIEGLQELVDFMAAHPEIPPPYGSQTVNLFPADILEAKEIVRAAGGRWEKADLADYLMFRRSFGPHSIEINLSKSDTCERVLVGTEEVPDPKAPKITVDKYEWRCPESLLALAEGAHLAVGA